MSLSHRLNSPIAMTEEALKSHIAAAQDALNWVRGELALGEITYEGSAPDRSFRTVQMSKRELRAMLKDAFRALDFMASELIEVDRELEARAIKAQTSKSSPKHKRMKSSRLRIQSGGPSIRKAPRISDPRGSKHSCNEP
jgi:hypothetical protein